MKLFTCKKPRTWVAVSTGCLTKNWVKQMQFYSMTKKHKMDRVEEKNITLEIVFL